MECASAVTLELAVSAACPAPCSTVLRGFVDPDLRRHAAFWEAELADRPYFCGTDFSAADILMSFPLEAFAARGTGTGPQVTDWLARIHARPAYQRALQQGGPYAYA